MAILSHDRPCGIPHRYEENSEHDYEEELLTRLHHKVRTLIASLVEDRIKGLLLSKIHNFSHPIVCLEEIEVAHSQQYKHNCLSVDWEKCRK